MVEGRSPRQIINYDITTANNMGSVLKNIISMGVDIESPRIGAIVVNYKSDDDTRQIVDQLHNICIKTVVIDNSTPSPDLADWCNNTEDVIYLQSKGNVGYAAGNNQGIRYLKGSCDCYFLVNPDTKLVDPNDVKKLGYKILTDSDLGIISPNINNSAESELRKDPAAVRLLHRFGLLPPIKDHNGDLIISSQVVGCSMMLSASMVDNIGPLDESFFLYAEEIEYCYRAREKGYQVAYDPQITVIHNDDIEGFSHPKPYQTYYRTRNVFLLARKRFSGITHVVFLTSTIILLYAIIINKKWRLLKPWIEGIIDGLHRREGKQRYLID